jgi:hypothetical protein
MFIFIVNQLIKAMAQKGQEKLFLIFSEERFKVVKQQIIIP